MSGCQRLKAITRPRGASCRGWMIAGGSIKILKNRIAEAEDPVLLHAPTRKSVTCSGRSN